MDRKQDGLSERLNLIPKTFPISMSADRRLFAGFIVALIAGIFGSPVVQKVALFTVFGVAIWITASLARRRREIKGETVPRMKSRPEEPPRPCPSYDLLLKTITHLTRIEMLIKRPQGLVASQEKQGFCPRPTA